MSETINLTYSGDYANLPLREADYDSVSVVVAAKSFGAAVAELRWSSQSYDPNDIDEQEWFSFSPPMTFGDSIRGRRNIDILGARALRIVVCCPDGTADAAAGVFYYPLQRR